MSQPPVTVLMTAFNAERYLESALRSIMTQSLKNIAILVIDDTSTDGTADILARLSEEDPRLKAVRLPENAGVASASNHGLSLIETPYVARMDADDLALPHRLETQLTFLEQNPDIQLVGSSIDQIDADDRVFRTSLRPRDAVANRWLARFFYPVNHPSTMFRRLRPDGSPYRYSEGMRSTLDYDFFAEVLRCGETVSLGEVLLQYRVHKGSISGTKYHTQQEQAARIARQIQADTLPAEICAALEPFNRAYLDFQPVPAAEICAAFQQMLARDLAAYPQRRVWFRRQSAQILLAALQRSGVRGKSAALSLARQMPTLVLALGMRYLETQARLPQALRSDPKM